MYDVHTFFFFLFIIFLIAVLRQPWVLNFFGDWNNCQHTSSSPRLPVKNLPAQHMQYFNVRVFPHCRLRQLYSNELQFIVLSVILGLMSTPCLNISCSTIISSFTFHTSYPMISSVLDPGGTASQNTSISEADTERPHTLDGASEGSRLDR